MSVRCSGGQYRNFASPIIAAVLGIHLRGSRALTAGTEELPVPVTSEREPVVSVDAPQEEFPSERYQL